MGRDLTKKVFRYRAVLYLSLACLIPACLAGAKAVTKLNKKSVTVKVGKSVKVKVLNVSAKKKVKWTVKNKKIATVKKGKITGKKPGNTKVFAVVGKKKLVCKVKVVAASKKKATPAPATQNTPAPKPQSTVVPSSAPVNTATANPTAEPTDEPVVTETPDPTATDLPGTPAYEESMVSGLEVDYHRYFERNYRDYKKIKEGVPRGEIVEVNYESTVVGATREAYVYTPPGYQEDKEYPVVYLLHGLGCDDGQWYGMSIEIILNNMIYNKEIEPVVAVIPSIVPKDGLNSNSFSPDNINAFTVFTEEFTKDLEPFILNNYSVSKDRKNTGVCGLSMGGMKALDLGFSLLDRFNYIGSFSAAPGLDLTKLRCEDENLVPEVVLVCNGSKDSTVGDNPLNYHNELTKNGVKHIWYIHPKGTHSDPVWINGVINFMQRSYGIKAE